jgi:hypothetical protein
MERLKYASELYGVEFLYLFAENLGGFGLAGAAALQFVARFLQFRAAGRSAVSPSRVISVLV